MFTVLKFLIGILSYQRKIQYEMFIDCLKMLVHDEFNYNQSNCL